MLLIRIKITTTTIEEGLYEDKFNTPYIFRCMFVCYKFYILIELKFLKELILIKQANQKSAMFVTIDMFQINALSFNQMSAIDVMIY